MNRSTLRSFSTVLATAVITLSFSPLAASAQTLPAPGVTADQAGTMDIVYGDGDEGAIYVGHISVTQAKPAPVVLGPGDVLFGDNDEGAIAQGPALVTAAAEADAAQTDPELIFGADNDGGSVVDLSAFRGRSNITSVELAGGTVYEAASAVDSMQAGNGCD